jgi:Glyoxalase-like domain
VIAVPDLAAAASELETRHGVASLAGGRHPGWGTANRIVPLGPCYLELVAVADRHEAATSAFGRWVAAAAPGPLGWAVRTDDLDAVAGRLGLAVQAGSRVAPDGRPLRWRLAGVEQAAAEPALPFVIEWGPGSALPGRAAHSHPAGPLGLARLRLSGDPLRLAELLGPDGAPPAEIRPGPPAVAGVVLAGPAGEIVL